MPLSTISQPFSPIVLDVKGIQVQSKSTILSVPCFSKPTYLSLLQSMVRKVGLFVENARGTFGGERKAPLTPSFYPSPILLYKTIPTLRLSIILLYAHSSVFLSKVNKVCIMIATIPCKKIFGTANSNSIDWFTIPYIYRKHAKTFIPTTI